MTSILFLLALDTLALASFLVSLVMPWPPIARGLLLLLIVLVSILAVVAIQDARGKSTLF